jgi:ParB-like chromosome segregation protein Spo0J
MMEKQEKKFEIKLLPASSLVPAPYNPRKISADDFELLKDSIREHGLVEPIVVQKSNNMIIGGHQRLNAFVEVEHEQGVKNPKTTCFVLDCDDATAKRLNLRLNRIGGEFDQDKLGQLFESEDFPEGFRFEELGFSAKEIERVLKTVAPPALDDPKPATFGRSVTLSLEFGDIEVRDQVKEWLIERAKLTQKRTGDVVQEMIRKGAKREPKERAAPKGASPTDGADQ